MKINAKTRESITAMVRERPEITIDEVVRLLDESGQKPDIARLVEAEKKRAARRLLASFRDQKRTRTYFSICDKNRTFVGVESCGDSELLSYVEDQLRIKRNGINRSLQKVTQAKKKLGVCADISGMDTEKTTVMAEKLYAMADELQALLAM